MRTTIATQSYLILLMFLFIYKYHPLCRGPTYGIIIQILKRSDFFKHLQTFAFLVK